MREEDMLIKPRIPEATDPSEWEVIEERMTLAESLDRLGRAWRKFVLVIAKETGITKLLDWLCKGR